MWSWLADRASSSLTEQLLFQNVLHTETWFPTTLQTREKGALRPPLGNNSRSDISRRPPRPSSSRIFSALGSWSPDLLSIGGFTVLDTNPLKASSHWFSECDPRLVSTIHVGLSSANMKTNIPVLGAPELWLMSLVTMAYHQLIMNLSSIKIWVLVCSQVRSFSRICFFNELGIGLTCNSVTFNPFILTHFFHPFEVFSPDFIT